MQYTFEVYKKDGRVKDGRKLIEKFDSELFANLSEAQAMVDDEYGDNPKIEVDIHETMIERVSAMDGKVFMERHDTPYYCSPSSETYWCS